MKRFYKEIVCLFFVLVMMFSLCTTTFFASETLGVVNGSVINTDSTAGNADLADIQLDVYALIPVFSDSNQTDYDKQFAFSVSTDANGEYSFTKPSAICVVEINEDTVADGYGVLTGVDIISADETTSELKISALATYEIDLEDNSLQFYNSQDEKLTVKENLNASVLSDVQLRTQEVETDSLLSYAEEGLSHVPSYTDEVIYTDGFFTYHYERGTLSDRELNLIRCQFNNTKASLCSTYIFRLPVSYANTTTYHIYLGDNLSFYGVTPGNASGSYIVIDTYDQEDINGVNNDSYEGLSARVMKTISHEFTHGIQYEYIGVAEGDWGIFNESVSECFGVLLSEYYSPSRLNAFQDTSSSSLFADMTSYRDYGTFLFTLHLYEEFSGFTTIRQIYEEFAVNTSLYTAMNNVLVENYNSSLIETFINFRVKNYDIFTNYELFGDYENISFESVHNTPPKTSITEDIVTYTTPMLSTMYFEFEAEVEDYYSFCFALQGETEKTEVNLTGIYTSPDGEQTIIEYPFNGRLKMPNVDMEAGSKICFLMSNINLTDTDIQFYTCTI